MSESTQSESQFRYYEFNYASIKLEPYAKDSSNSSQLMKRIIEHLNDPKFPKSKKIIDRYEKRQGTEKRLLVHISSPFEKEGKRVFGKIALIKNKSIFMLSESDIIEEIEKPQNKEIIELTNYSITFDPSPIIMIEFNSSGPRLTDVEYYFRQIARDAKIAKAIKTSLHLNVEYSKLAQNIENVFYVEVKVKSNEIYKTGAVDWYGGLKTLNDAVGYRDVRLEFFYSRNKNPNTGNYIKNIKGLDFARNILDWLKKDRDNIESVDDLKMSYSTSGSDEIIDLDFIKNKTTSVVSIPVANIGSRQSFNYEVGMEFNSYLSTGKVTTEPKK